MRIPRRVGEGELFGDDSRQLIGSIVRRVGFSVLLSPPPALAVLLASAATIVDGDDLKLPTSRAANSQRDEPDFGGGRAPSRWARAHTPPRITHAYSTHAPSQ